MEEPSLREGPLGRGVALGSGVQAARWDVVPGSASAEVVRVHSELLSQSSALLQLLFFCIQRMIWEQSGTERM